MSDEPFPDDDGDLALMHSRLLPNTYLVSMIEGEGGSGYYFETAAKTPREAAEAYMSDRDNMGAELARAFLRKKESERILLCVLDKTVTHGGERWKVHLFEIDDINSSPGDFDEIREFY